MKKAPQLAATWLVGGSVRLRPLEASDVPKWRHYRVTADPRASAFIIQTKSGRDVGALALLVEGPLAAISVSSPDGPATAQYVAESLRVMCEGAFRSQPLVRIEALVSMADARARRAYRRAGFRHEGVIRAAIRARGGGYRDAAVLSRLRNG